MKMYALSLPNDSNKKVIKNQTERAIPMDSNIPTPAGLTPATLTEICANADASAGIEALVANIRELVPELELRCVLSRGGWHRLGGVVDKHHNSISHNIVQWVEDECGGDVDELIANYLDSEYFATNLAGKTHFITAPIGDSPDAYIQIEVEELCEVLNRPLVQPDWYPDDVEEFLEPLDYPHVEPDPVAKPYYQFRRITNIDALLSLKPGSSRQIRDLRRFCHDWEHSSAGHTEEVMFCRHWVFGLREYIDHEGDSQLTAKPVSTFTDEGPELPHGGRIRGVELANAIHHYDRHVGYPFAWYFMMLTQKASNYALAEAVLADQMGAYEYLPSRDLAVLREWEQRPYGV
jgi:hypothetical protein